MESWFREQDVESSEFLKLIRTLKRDTSEESGYVSADSDMVTGKVEKISKIQISPYGLRSHGTDIENRATSDDDFSFLDISNSLSKCCINFKCKCVHTISADVKVFSSSAVKDNRNSKYDRGCAVRDRRKIASKSGSCGEKMNESGDQKTTSKNRDLILDFESSPEILAQTEDTKTGEPPVRTPTTKGCEPSTSKQKESPEEKSVVVPTGKCCRA